MAGAELPQSIESRIFSRIKHWGPGTVVLPSQSVYIGSREAVGIGLHRLVKTGQIRRVARGVDDLPRVDPLLGELSPTIEAITKALTERDRITRQPPDGFES